MEAEFRAVTMLYKSALVSYFLLGWMCRFYCHVEKCCFLVPDEGEKLGAGEARKVHISLAVRF